MSSRLGPDSPIHRALSWIAALVVANLACVLLSLPLVTAGAGLLATALVSVRLIESESTALLPALSQSLRGAGLAASILLIGEGVLALLLAWEWPLVSALANPSARIVARAVLVLVAAVLVLAHVWVWPMLAYRLVARGRVVVADLPRLLRASLLVSIAKLPRSLLAIAVAVGPLALVALSLPWTIRMSFWFLVFGIAFSMYVCVLATKPVLNPDPVA